MKTPMTNYKLPRILMVGTLPYNPNESSRALDTYFHNWPKENLRMIYSNVNPPVKGQCGSFFQITDKEMINKFFHRRREVGTIYNYEDLDNVKEVDNHWSNKLKKRNSLRYYLRKTLWGKKRWLSAALIKWIEEFNPEIIYISYSDDYFIMDIAYTIATKYNLPIIGQISDDYYFRKEPLLKYCYLKKYKKLFQKILNTEGFNIFISDKITKKYNDTFPKQGFPVYLSSDIVNGHKEIKYEFNYFGKINLGRYKSLGFLSETLNKINQDYYVNVYTSEITNSQRKYLEKRNCKICKPLPYADVKEIMNSGSFNIIASGFAKKDIEFARYSLSTKVADALASSGPIIAVGPVGDGAIDYLRDNNCALILDKTTNFYEFKRSIDDLNVLEEYRVKAQDVFLTNHSVEKNRKKFEEACINLVRNKND